MLIYSDLLKTLFDFNAPKFFGSEYVPLVFGTAVFFYGGWLFLSSAWREIKGRSPGMMTLISLAILTAYSYSIYSIFSGSEKTLFWELTTLIVIMLLGHWIEMRAVQSAQGALKALSKLLPEFAEVVRGKEIVKVSLKDLKEGDLVAIKPGSKVPADGKVVDGSSEVNESLITGESKPVYKSVNDEVIAGSINGDGLLIVKVSNIGENTFLAGVMNLVLEAQASKSKIHKLADRAAFYLTFIAIGSGAITFTTWISVGLGANFAFERLVAVLVIACPHALGLAIPLVASISTTKAAKNGFLVKQRLALETARNIDIVLFDKTGTLTKGEYGLVKVVPVEGYSEEKVLQFAASVDVFSEHSVSKSVVKEAQKRQIEFLPAKDFKRLPGKGVRASVNNKEVMVGGHSLLNELNLEIPESIASTVKNEQSKGNTTNFMVIDSEVVAMFAHADVIRDESKNAIEQLHKMKIKTAMITGDSEAVANWVAKELNIDEYFAKVLPEGKSEKVKELQSRGLKVAMVGDGINDAPALTRSDLGIAIGAGTNVAIESAGIILVKNDPRDIVKIINLSKMTYNKMIQNLFWASGYNLLALPIAAGALYKWGILLNPAVAAIFMSLSTIIVAANAMLLKRKEL